MEKSSYVAILELKFNGKNKLTSLKDQISRISAITFGDLSA
jgi:hypothetical protein